MGSPGPFSLHPGDFQIIRCDRDGPIAITTVPLAAKHSDTGKGVAKENARRIVRALNSDVRLYATLEHLVRCHSLGDPATLDKAMSDAKSLLAELI